MLTKLQETGLKALLPKMIHIDAMNCMDEFEKEYDMHIDWHVFSNTLDRLCREKYLRISHARWIDGMTRYELIK